MRISAQSTSSMPPGPRTLLRSIRLRRRSKPGSHDDPTSQGGTDKLAAVVQALTFAVKTAEATSIPYLKGAIGMALVIAECIRVSVRDVVTFAALRHTTLGI